MAAAYGMGVVLPLLEALRRGTSFHPLHAYADDFVAGALLLVAARASTRGWRNADAWLAGAWGVLAGGLSGSFFWQLSEISKPDVSGHAGRTVVLVKGVLYAIAIVGLVLSIRRAGRAGTLAPRVD